MFGRRYFAGRYFGARFWGDGDTTVAPVFEDQPTHTRVAVAADRRVGLARLQGARQGRAGRLLGQMNQ